jgi:hypothetical protein
MSYQGLVKITQHRHRCIPCDREYDCAKYHNSYIYWARCERHGLK